MSKRAELTDTIERILRSRTYDRHAYDADVFDELLDEIDEAVLAGPSPTDEGGEGA